LAETGGFEPPIRCDPYNGLANRRLQPLGHVSTLGNPYRLSVFASMRATQRAHIARTTSICGGTQGGTARLVICDARQRLPAQGALLRCAGTSKQCQPPGHKTGNMQFIAASRDCGFSWAQGGLHGQRAVRCRCNHSRARPGPQLPPHLKNPPKNAVTGFAKIIPRTKTVIPAIIFIRMAKSLSRRAELLSVFFNKSVRAAAWSFETCDS
jgi:hypothetical protein